MIETKRHHPAISPFIPQTMNATKRLIPAILAALAAFCLFAGCSAIPPGSCAFWEHTGNYGPYQSHIVAHGVVKQADGSFRVADYTAFATWLGIGPHDTVQGLEIATAAPVVGK